MFKPLLYSSILIPLWGGAVLRQSTIRGLEKPLHAVIPDTIIRPLLTITGVALIYLISPLRGDATSAIIVNIIASVIALGIAIVWARKFTPKETVQTEPKYEIQGWVKSAAPLLLFNGAQIIISQSPLVLLGLLGSSIDTGMYNVAARLSNIMIYLPLAIGFVTSPLIARFNTTGKKEELQKILKKSVWGSFILSLILTMIFWIFGKKILSIFGMDFVPAYRALVILGIGYLVDISLGSSINLLMMTGYERIIAIFSGVNAISNVIFCILIIPYYGYEGAALVATITLVISRYIFALYAYKKTGLHTALFNFQIKE
jgi:O-antigen/teichoic acid export membrane protein